jgi:hypothetical protein
MSPALRRERYRSIRLKALRRYVAYAAGEILLIFVGITLALWFSNWNETRHVRAQEAHALADIATNLRVNAHVIRGKIEKDRRSVAACERVTAALARRDPWSSAVGKELMQCRWWTSPFLNAAAYDSLKAKGTDLVADPALRSQIVNLYEQVYAYLVNDTDKVFWAFHTAVAEPVLNRHVYPVSADEYAPNDYTALLESPEFGNMLQQKVQIQRISIQDQQRTLAATEKVLRSIGVRLAADQS